MQGLRDLGYFNGKNIVIEVRNADGTMDRLPELAAQLVRLKVNVIVAVGGQATLPAKHATSTIPIVFTLVSDPVGAGLVASLARPGGNLTGLSSVSTDLSGKRLELLKETIPKGSRVAVLYDPTDRSKIAEVKEIKGDARSLGVQLQALEVRRLDQFENAFKTASRAKVSAILVLPTSTTVSIISIHHVAAGASREFSDDRPSQTVAQRGDGVGHVTLRALGCREVCNLRVGKAFLIEWSFF